MYNVVINSPWSECLSLSDHLLSIAVYVFAATNSLAAINIPASVTSIGQGAFQSSQLFCRVWDSTISRTISDYAWTYIGLANNNYVDQCFDVCRRSLFLTISVCNVSVAPYAFVAGCTQLRSVVMTSGVVALGSFGFQGCSGLVASSIGTGVLPIADNVQRRRDCPRPTSFAVPENVKSIRSNSFASCSSVKSLTFANRTSDITLDTQLWYGNQALTTVTLGNGMTSIPYQ
eukprot:gene72-96_t